MINIFDLSFDWHLTNNCNFNCVYCHPQIKRVLNTKSEKKKSNKEILSSFNSLHKICHISMSGGEPFLFPDFVNFCKEVTKKHYISINTNLSKSCDVEEFGRVIDPSRVLGIYAAMHVLERDRLGLPMSKFVSDVLYLQNKGFNITVFYVLYPTLLDRFIIDSRILKEAGVKFVAAKIFKGVYDGKIYPAGYSEEERRKIESFKDDYKFTKSYLTDDTHFKGRLCNAGKSFFKVEVNGDVHRCASCSKSMGNLYDGTFKINERSTPCSTREALCVSHCNINLVK